MALPQRRDPEEERRYNEAERRRIATEPARGGFGGWWLWIILIIAIIWFAGWGWGGYGGWWWGRRGVAPVTNNANVSPTGVTPNGTHASGAAAAPSGEGVAILSAADKRQYIGQRVDLRDVPVQNKINDRALWIGNTNANGNAGTNGANNGIATGAGVKGTNGAAPNPNATVGPGGVGINAGNTTNNGTNAKPGAESSARSEVPTLVVFTSTANAGQTTGGTHGAKNKANAENGDTANNSMNGSLKDVNEGALVNVIGTVEKAPSANVAEKEWGLSHDAARQLERDGAYVRATQVTTATPANH